MSIAKANKRECKEDYINFGFTCLQKDGEDIPVCVWCMKTLVKSCLKLFQLRQHLNKPHKEQASKSVEHVSIKKVVSNFKKV